MDVGEQTIEVMYEYGLIGYTDKVLAKISMQDTLYVFWLILLCVCASCAYVQYKLKNKKTSSRKFPNRKIAKDFDGSARIITNKGYTQFKDVRLKLDNLNIPRDPNGVPYTLNKKLNPFLDYDLMEAEKKSGAKYHYVRKPKGITARRKGTSQSRISGQEKLNG